MTVPLVTWNSEQRRYELALVDPATGNRVPDRLPVGLTEKTSFEPTLALSPDGSRLAVVTGVGSACEPSGIGHACWPSADLLRLIDLRTGREALTDLPTHPPAKGWAGPLAFSVDGGRFALAYHDRIGTTALLFDAETGQLIGQQVLAIRPRLMEFTADGAWLVIYGSPLAEIPGFLQPDLPSALLLDGESLEIRWSLLLPNILDGAWCREDCSIDGVTNSESGRFAYWSPAVIFDAEMGRLHIVHADEDQLTTVDFRDRSVQSLAIGPRPTWIERLLALTPVVAEAKGWPEGRTKSAALSQDGTRLYVTGAAWNLSRDPNGDWLGTSTPLGLQVIEASTGHELDTLESDATRIRISADRRYLILDWGSTGSIELVEAETLKVAGHVEDWELVASLRVDGQPVLLATQASESGPTQLAMVASKTFEVLSEWSVSGLAYWLTAP
jgi:hypothetical protein